MVIRVVAMFIKLLQHTAEVYKMTVVLLICDTIVHIYHLKEKPQFIKTIGKLKNYSISNKTYKKLVNFELKFCFEWIAQEQFPFYFLSLQLS